jgi:hypothetical protein
VGWSYWKIVCKYGHIGFRKEVSVARYLRLPVESCLLDAYEVAKMMPGVKNKGVFSGKKILLDEYLSGHQGELDNFYLKNLKTFKQQSA